MLQRGKNKKQKRMNVRSSLLQYLENGMVKDIQIQPEHCAMYECTV